MFPKFPPWISEFPLSYYSKYHPVCLIFFGIPYPCKNTIYIFLIPVYNINHFTSLFHSKTFPKYLPFRLIYIHPLSSPDSRRPEFSPFPHAALRMLSCRPPDRPTDRGGVLGGSVFFSKCGHISISILFPSAVSHILKYFLNPYFFVLNSSHIQSDFASAGFFFTFLFWRNLEIQKQGEN